MRPNEGRRPLQGGMSNEEIPIRSGDEPDGGKSTGTHNFNRISVLMANLHAT